MNNNDKKRIVDANFKKMINSNKIRCEMKPFLIQY